MSIIFVTAFVKLFVTPSPNKKNRTHNQVRFPFSQNVIIALLQRNFQSRDAQFNFVDAVLGRYEQRLHILAAEIKIVRRDIAGDASEMRARAV